LRGRDWRLVLQLLEDSCVTWQLAVVRDTRSYYSKLLKTPKSQIFRHSQLPKLYMPQPRKQERGKELLRPTPPHLSVNVSEIFTKVDFTVIKEHFSCKNNCIRKRDPMHFLLRASTISVFPRTVCDLIAILRPLVACTWFPTLGDITDEQITMWAPKVYQLEFNTYLHIHSVSDRLKVINDFLSKPNVWR
jgi:hypothetical protein